MTLSRRKCEMNAAKAAKGGIYGIDAGGEPDLSGQAVGNASGKTEGVVRL